MIFDMNSSHSFIMICFLKAMVSIGSDGEATEDVSSYKDALTANGGSVSSALLQVFIFGALASSFGSLPVVCCEILFAMSNAMKSGNNRFEQIVVDTSQGVEFLSPLACVHDKKTLQWNHPRSVVTQTKTTHDCPESRALIHIAQGRTAAECQRVARELAITSPLSAADGLLVTCEQQVYTLKALERIVRRNAIAATTYDAGIYDSCNTAMAADTIARMASQRRAFAATLDALIARRGREKLELAAALAEDDGGGEEMTTTAGSGGGGEVANKPSSSVVVVSASVLKNGRHRLRLAAVAEQRAFRARRRIELNRRLLDQVARYVRVTRAC
jgi:hypothetical protein